MLQVGAVSFSIAYLSDWERSKALLKKHFHQHAAEFFKPLVLAILYWLIIVTMSTFMRLYHCALLSSPPPNDPQYRELTHGEKCAAFLIVVSFLLISSYSIRF